MKVRNTIGAFKKNADIHRHPFYQKLPTAAKLQSLPTDEANALFNKFEKDFYKNLEDNSKAFDRAIVRISLCAFIKGLLRPFDADMNYTKHYTWCPYDEWMNSANSATTFGANE